MHHHRHNPGFHITDVGNLEVGVSGVNAEVTCKAHGLEQAVRPLLVPIVTALGIDPIHFGIVMCLNLTIGGITPPFGILMFTTSSILDISIAEYTKAALPFIVTAIIVLLLVTYIPGIVLLLPRLIMP